MLWGRQSFQIGWTIAGTAGSITFKVSRVSLSGARQSCTARTFPRSGCFHSAISTGRFEWQRLEERMDTEAAANSPKTEGSSIAYAAERLTKGNAQNMKSFAVMAVAMLLAISPVHA